jgi:sec-independent protein translocase protein TatC
MVRDSKEEIQMTFWEHLEELRRRILKALVAFALGLSCSWYFREEVLIWLTTPFVAAWTESISGTPKLHFPAPASLFLAYLRLSLLSGLVFALPVIFYQIWAFIAPGLYSRERRLALPFVVSSTLLFLGGGYFGWRVAFPVAFKYLLGFSGSIGGSTSIAIDLEPTVMIGEYIEFVSRMLLAFGATFELPVLVFFLTIAGVVNHTHLIKFARYFVVLAFFISAVITPPDIMSQFLLAMPLILLYVVSIGIAWLMARKTS